MALHHTQQLKRSYLTSVELFGTDGQSLVTKFDYGLVAEEEAASTMQGTYAVTGRNWSLTPGDYNGDGKSDLVVANELYTVADNEIKSTTSSLYNLITNAGVPASSYSLEPTRFELQTTYPSTTFLKVNDDNRPYAYLNTDMDGDGKDELLRISKSLNRYQDSRGDWHDNGMYFINDINIDKFNSNGQVMTSQPTGLLLPADYTGTYNYYLKDANSVIQGDFDGDGSVDILNILGRRFKSGEIIERRFNVFGGWYVYRNTPVYDYAFKTFFTNKTTNETNVEVLSLTDQVKDAKDIYPIDLDGDGKDELLVFKGSNFVIYSIDRAAPSSGASFSATQLLTSYQIGFDYYKRIVVGDFNGDKKTDILGVTNSTSTTLLYSTGTGFVSAALNLSRTPDFAGAWPDRILTGDFNGDGLTDIMHAYEYPVTVGSTTTYYPEQDIYYTKGVDYGTSYTYQTSTVCPQDYNYWMMSYPDTRIVGYTYDYPCYTGQPWPNDYEQGYIVQYNFQTTVVYTPIFTIKRNYLGGMISNYLVPLEVGDFNGDGKADVIQSSLDNLYAVFYFTDVFSNKNCSKLQKVTDGLGNITSIDYSTLAAGGATLYSVSAGAENGFPYNTTSLPISVVRSLSQPDATGGTQTTSYTYKDAILHRSKGLLGFKEFTVSNDVAQVKTESVSELNKTYSMLVPAGTKSYLNNVLTGEMQNNVVITTIANNSTRYFSAVRYKPQTSYTLEIDQLQKSAKKTSYQYDASGNITLLTAETGAWLNNAVTAVETVTTSTTYAKVGKAIFPFQPTLVSVTSTRAGEPTATQVTNMTYTADRGLLASKTAWSGTPIASITNYTYDTYGNVTQTINKVSNQVDVSTTISYDASHRFAVKSVVQRGTFSSTSSATYDQYWGKQLTQTVGDGTAGSLTTTYEYDRFGSIKKTTTPLGHAVTQSLAWDVSGNQLYYRFTDYPAGVDADEKVWYDKLGNVVKKQTLGWNNQWKTETTKYDNKGRTTETTKNTLIAPSRSSINISLFLSSCCLK